MVMAKAEFNLGGWKQLPLRAIEYYCFSTNLELIVLILSLFAFIVKSAIQVFLFPKNSGTEVKFFACVTSR